jgi:methylisocitrate lyase
MIPGVFNALTARTAERLGYQAVYLSGGALSAGWAGVPDIGLLSVTEFADQAAVLARATALPLLCDADTGFGDVLNVERTVRLYEQAGAAGLHLEDQVMPKRCGHLTGKSLVEPSAMVAKIRAARTARQDPEFVIVARTDARSVEGFSAALERAHAYREAGADMIFPEALETREEFSLFADELNFPLLANMTEFGRSPLIDFADLEAMGYKAVLYPLTAFRAASAAAEQTLRDLRDTGSQRSSLTRMQTRQELYDLIGYTNWEERDRAYFQRVPESDSAPASGPRGKPKAPSSPGD